MILSTEKIEGDLRSFAIIRDRESIFDIIIIFAITAFSRFIKGVVQSSTKEKFTEALSYLMEMNCSEETSCERRYAPCFAFTRSFSASSLDTVNAGFLNKDINKS